MSSSRLMKWCVPTLVLIAAAAAATLATAAPPPLDFDSLFVDDAAGRQAKAITWAPDGEQLAYQWHDGSGDALWIQAVPGSEPRRILAIADLGEDVKLDSYRFSADSRKIVLLAADDLWIVDLEAAELTRLTTTEAEEEDPRFSPDGAKLAFVRDANLYLLDLASGDERALTSDGEPDITLNGITDWVYWEELWSRDSRGFWWSPDGLEIALYQFDETPVESYPLVKELDGAPTVRWQKYPVAGAPLPRVRVGVLTVADGAIEWMTTGEPDDAYLARVDWRPDGERLAIQKLNRDQTRLELLECDPVAGDCRTLATQESATWVNLEDHFAWLEAGGFLWSTEESGWRRLYRYGADGQRIATVSPDSWSVTSLDAVDESRGQVLYTAFQTFGSGARERHVFRLPLAGGHADKISLEGGWNSAKASPEGHYWVHTWSDANHPVEIAIRDAQGKAVAELPFAPPIGYFDSSQKYPVIVYHYGCPASQVVGDRWGTRIRGLWHKLMAERGYVVFLIDNQASIFFGKEGEDREHRQFGPAHMAALDAALDYLAAQSWADTDRLGIWGWSGGGSNTLAAILHRPGAWRAAVAGAPVTDWHLYDAIWTERYLDRPQDNEDGYVASSPLTHAAKLEDSLLIVHGTGDDNVHPQNTTVMNQALIKAGLPFEMAWYPGQKHGFRDPARRHFFERMTEFFDRQLAADDDSDEMDGEVELIELN